MTPDRLFFDYLSERHGVLAILVEHGFVTYKIKGKECFLADMYIAKDARGSGLARKLIAQLAEIAKAAECEAITANVHLNLLGSNHTLQAAMTLGFRVERAEGNVLLIALPISGGG